MEDELFSIHEQVFYVSVRVLLVLFAVSRVSTVDVERNARLVFHWLMDTCERKVCVPCGGRGVLEDVLILCLWLGSAYSSTLHM